MTTVVDRRGDEILLGFTRALRAAGVAVTQDRARRDGGLQAPQWARVTPGPLWVASRISGG